MATQTDDSFASFGGKIPRELKDRIDEQLKTTKLPMGRIVEALAEYWVELNQEEQRLFCYGVAESTLCQFLDRRIAAFLQSPEGAAVLDDIVAARIAAERSRIEKPRRKPVGA